MHVTEDRVRELDGLRAAAVLFVVAWHYIGMQGTSGDGLWSVVTFGRGGVDLFFVMSGYLITRILLRHRDSENFFSVFYGRRCFRILPVYWLIVGIWLATKVGRMNEYDLPWWSYIIGVQNVFMALQQTYGAYSLAPTWSLAVEEQFYLIFPPLVRFASSRSVFRLLVFLIVACPIGRIAAFQLGDSFGWSVLTILRADILAIGALVAMAETGAVKFRAYDYFPRIFWIAALSFPIFSFAVAGENSNAHWACWGHTYLVALIGPGLSMVLQNQGTPRLAFLRTDLGAFFAKISYPLYLIHETVFRAVNGAVGTKFVTIITSFALAVLISTALSRLIETPMIAIGRRKFKFLFPVRGDPVIGVDAASCTQPPAASEKI